jgi:hypothetical protein
MELGGTNGGIVIYATTNAVVAATATVVLIIDIATPAADSIPTTMAAAGVPMGIGIVIVLPRL